MRPTRDVVQVGCWSLVGALVAALLVHGLGWGPDDVIVSVVVALLTASLVVSLTLGLGGRDAGRAGSARAPQALHDTGLTEPPSADPSPVPKAEPATWSEHPGPAVEGPRRTSPPAPVVPPAPSQRKWWERSPDRVADAAIHDVHRPEPPSPAVLDDLRSTSWHREAQCPSCGRHVTEIQKEFGRLDSFHCRHCSYRWNWAVGQPWPEVTVRPDEPAARRFLDG